jgi:hypothetical protein
MEKRRLKKIEIKTTKWIAENDFLDGLDNKEWISVESLLKIKEKLRILILELKQLEKEIKE